MPNKDLSPHPEEERLVGRAAGVYSVEELRAKLHRADDGGQPLRIKLGMDPSSPDIHVGHSVVLSVMRAFQDLGHKAVLIVGDYTARIGDPTGKSKTRPMLTPEQIDANAQTYIEQASKILDPDPARFEVRRNSEWLEGMSFADVIRLTSQMTVARMLERDTFQKRYQASEAVYIHEFLYPLMQGWDSVCINSDVELGGTDQTYNNLVGRDLQVGAGQEAQVVITMPLLRGTDGAEKMSKSLGNAIGLLDSPDDMFGKTMSIPDELMDEWFTLLGPTLIGQPTFDPQAHPREEKARLGAAIVDTYHGEGAGAKAAEEFTRRFREHQLPSDIETHTIDTGAITAIVALVASVGFAQTNSEARRLIKQGAVSLDEVKLTDPVAAPADILQAGQEHVLKVGKRRVCKVKRA
jgi:tyrosyl-tRNA synthetase